MRSLCTQWFPVYTAHIFFSFDLMNYTVNEFRQFFEACYVFSKAMLNVNFGSYLFEKKPSQRDSMTISLLLNIWTQETVTNIAL